MIHQMQEIQVKSDFQIVSLVEELKDMNDEFKKLETYIFVVK